MAAAALRAGQAIAAQQAKIDEWERRDAADRAAGGRGLARNPPRRPAHAHCSVVRAKAKLARAQARAARTRRRAAERAAARKGPGPVANITDPHSRLMPVRGGGFTQGYNAQAAHSAGGLCLGGLVTAGTTDYASFGPLLTAIAAAQDILREHARGPAGQARAFAGIVLADAGYLSQDNLTCSGPERLIATGKNRQVAAAAAGHAGPARRSGGAARGTAALAMAARFAQPHWAGLYKRRGPIAEGAFGNRKHNLNFRAFTMRGLARASGEWTFQNTTCNLLKIFTAGWQPA